MKYAEMLNAKGSETRGNAPQKTAESGPRIAQLSRGVLTDGTRGSADLRKEKALGLLCSEIGRRGGRLAAITLTDGTRKVDGEVRVAAGNDKAERRVKAGTSTTVVTFPKGMDEKVARAAVGYGMGALAVSYRVDRKGNAEYVIRTNGSSLCAEENLLNVAMALAGAAEMVENLLNPGKLANVVELASYRKADGRAMEAGKAASANS